MPAHRQKASEWNLKYHTWYNSKACKIHAANASQFGLFLINLVYVTNFASSSAAMASKKENK